MVESHREKAMRSEKKARSTSRASKYSKPKKQEASKFYEVAGDEWFKQSRDINSRENPRDFRYAVSDAIRNYELAIKIAEKEEKERIRNKIDSTEKAYDLVPVKGLQKKLGFGIVAILNLIAASFFISLNLTGSTVGNRDSSALMGVIFFITGLVFTFFYFKEKNKKIS